MTDEDALLALGAGEEPDKASAREHLADAHVPWLLGYLTERFGWDEDLAIRAATGAFYRLLGVAERSPNKLPEPSRLRSWLIKAAWFERTDELRRDRGRQQAAVVQLDETNEEDQKCVIDPDDAMEHADVGRIVLEYVLGLDQPERGILLFDTLAHIEELLDEDLSRHNCEMIDWGHKHDVWTKTALESHRKRARKDLREYLSRRGITP